MEKEIKLFEAFAGVGAQYRALKNISRLKNWKIKVVGIVEWFVDAIIGYVAINSSYKNNKDEKLDDEIENISFDSKNLVCKKRLKVLDKNFKSGYLNFSKKEFNNLFDIRCVDKSNLPKGIDILTYSFPCQDLSLQGLQKGLNKEKKTRSGLLWEIERILIDAKKSFKKIEMPKYLLMENVSNILCGKHKKDFEYWVEKLDDLGYESKVYKLNASDFGLAQNRVRVFCLSIRKDFKNESGFEFRDGFGVKESQKLKDVCDVDGDGKVIDLSGFEMGDWRTTKQGIVKKDIFNYSKFNSENYVYGLDGTGPTLTASGANSRIKIEIDKNVIRYMNAKECCRYMGFNDVDYENLKKTGLLNDNKIIFLMGNSIAINVLEEIFKSLKF